MNEPILFTEWDCRGVRLRNRIVMSPMCMYSCAQRDGRVESWHKTHYPSRAVGGAGLIVVEATAVRPEGRISPEDLGIWSEEHIPGLRELCALVQEAGAKIGIQLAHAGRKSKSGDRIVAPSAIPFDEGSATPEAMTASDLRDVVEAFRDGARRARDAGFDVVELHAAHGYLLNSFLSPLTNRRTDAYGGGREGRFRLLGEAIEAVRTVWDGPLFVRFSADEYAPGGSTMEDMIDYATRAKALGVDLIDVSSGGVVPARVEPYPGYQIPYAESIRRGANVPVGAVGLIAEPELAEHTLRAERADLIFLGRELLRQPYWPLHAARTLGAAPPLPKPYERAWL